mmetsp:Transcript_230/g.357  ORF Transcript_230/g.357 Transcript_230/m.357 type:complete len:494 (+) Transcript_230:3-1484(+)
MLSSKNGARIFQSCSNAESVGQNHAINRTIHHSNSVTNNDVTAKLNDEVKSKRGVKRYIGTIDQISPRNRNKAKLGSGSCEVSNAINKILNQKQDELETKIREIGKKTRRRFEEERRNRKEIVRIDASVAPPLPQTTRRNDKSERNKHTRESSHPSQICQQFKKKRDDSRKEYHTHNEDLDNLGREDDQTRGNASNVVRLDGNIHMHLKPEKIFKFFNGLAPQQVFLLPPYEGYISELDSTNSYEEEDSNDEDEDYMNKSFLDLSSPIVPKSRQRIYVKFPSVQLAEMACKRSNEKICFEPEHDHQDGKGKNCDDIKNSSITIHINVLPVSKDISTFILQNMAIQCFKKNSLQNSLSDFDRRVPEVIQQTLWAMAKIKLNLFDIDLPFIGEHISVSKLQNIKLPFEKSEYQHLVSLYNNLWDQYHELEYLCTPFIMHDWNPSITRRDSCRGLTITAMRWIQDQMERILACLTHFRVFCSCNCNDNKDENANQT